MRSLRRTFRYGVAYAYERAVGGFLTRGPNDRTRVYDLAQAYIPANPEHHRRASLDCD